MTHGKYMKRMSEVYFKCNNALRYGKSARLAQPLSTYNTLKCVAFLTHIHG